MIKIMLHCFEDFSWKVNTVSVEIDNSSEKERIDARVYECGLTGMIINEYALTDEWKKRFAEMLGVEKDMILLDGESYDYQEKIKALGFTCDEIETIMNNFICRISLFDWNEMKLVEEENDELYPEESIQLPTGRWVMFGEELLRKEMLAQVD